jgi:uncharacterized protein YunC (DUF1805 family)
MVPLTIDQRHAGTVLATFADPLEIAVEKVIATNFQALLDDLGCILVNAVVCGKSKDVVDSAATVGGSSMFADVLDAPIAELAMRDHINTGQHLVDARTLLRVSL